MTAGPAGAVELALRTSYRARQRRPRLAALWVTLGVAAAFSAYQVHHLERLVAARCAH